MASLTSPQRLRLEHQERLLVEVRAEVSRAAVPYFGHLRLETARGETNVLLGPATRITPKLSIIDWLHAPLAELFFTLDEGDEYELDTADRVLTGRVLEKNLLEFSEGALTAIEGGGHRLERQGDGRWSAKPAAPAWHAIRAPEARKPFRSPLEVTLDPAQQQVVDLPADQSVLILGEAGYGKTTVALHRLVSLQERRGRGFKAAVIVPTEGLRRLTQLMLERRGATGFTRVWTYDEWAAFNARQAFKDLPKRESANTRSFVQRLKRHPAMLTALEAFAAENRRPAQDAERPRRLHALASRLDLEKLLGDRAWLKRVVDQAGGALPEASIEETAQHTKVQFLESSERAHAHVDRDQLVTSDGRRIDEGTPLEDAESVDVEDYALMFALDAIRARQSGATPTPLSTTYDCVLLDESQEFSPLELALIGRSLRRNGTLIVAGDAAQQVDPVAFFSGWAGVLEALGVPGATRRELKVNYRCPEDVTGLARSVLDASHPSPSALPSVSRFQLRSPFHLAYALSRVLQTIRHEDPLASVALICRSAEVARALARGLRHGIDTRLSLAGDFDFRPGVLITCVPDVKGLEFDYVCVADASAGAYPDAPESRRSLYVAVTRATHRLLLATSSAWSPLLPRAEDLHPNRTLQPVTHRNMEKTE